MSMQKEYKDHRSFWFIDQVREYILTLEDDISPPSEGRKKSVLNAAQASSSGSSSTDDLSEVVSKLAASVAAIVTKAETSSRVKNSFNKGNERPYDAKMGPCRFCGGSHRHRDCHTLKTASPKPPIPPRVGAAKGVSDNDTPGFLMGAVAADQPSCSSRSSTFPTFMALLTTFFWFIVAYISFTTRGNISFQNNLHCKAVAGSATTPSFDNGFGVDSYASDHICHDKGVFSSLDSSKYKTFEVVHGETITSSGVGDVELLVCGHHSRQAQSTHSSDGTCTTSPSKACL